MKLNKKNLKEVGIYTLIILLVLYAFPLLVSFVFALLLGIEFLKVFIICDVIWHIGYVIAVNIFDFIGD